MPKEKILKSFAIIARVILQKSADVKKKYFGRGWSINKKQGTSGKVNKILFIIPDE